MLYPFWGKYDEQGDPDAGRYDVYTREGRQYFQLVPLTECDFAVLPIEWKPDDDGLRRFAQEAERAGKTILAFSQGDFEEPIPLPRSYIFRSSLSRSRQAPNEFPLPAWSVDFCERYTGGRLPLRGKGVLPAVSYCGYGSKWKTRLKRLLNYPPNPGEGLRVRALHYLARSGLVRTNFLLRPGYWGGVFQREPPERISAARIALRQEYVTNMIESDYVLCCRGRGNFSCRLYEALSLGRIPILVNTDCVLPYERHINWRSLCVWVESSELESIAQKVAAFHAGLSGDAFLSLQQRCRLTWEEWLSPQGFFRHLRADLAQCRGGSDGGLL